MILRFHNPLSTCSFIGRNNNKIGNRSFNLLCTPFYMSQVWAIMPSTYELHLLSIFWPCRVQALLYVSMHAGVSHHRKPQVNLLPKWISKYFLIGRLKCSWAKLCLRRFLNNNIFNRMNSNVKQDYKKCNLR